jgi:SAM-dependent methyltransferase
MAALSVWQFGVDVCCRCLEPHKGVKQIACPIAQPHVDGLTMPTEVGVANSRSALIMATLDRSMSIVEIGPSYNPIVPKSEGWHTTIVDHASRTELQALYTQHNVATDRIEEVDIVWSGGALADAFPTEALGTFDAVVASHVIEHSPDVVTFLQSCHALLKESGRLVLVIPDKRQCFDFFKPHSTSADALEAFAQKRSRHRRSTHFLHVAFAAQTSSGIAWGQAPPFGLSLVHRLHQAWSRFHSVSDDPAAPYTDCHAWFFTPASFELLSLDLRALQLVHLETEYVSPSFGSEFVAFLRPRSWMEIAPDDLATQRLALLKRELLELREQADAMLAADQDVRHEDVTA